MNMSRCHIKFMAHILNLTSCLWSSSKGELFKLVNISIQRKKYTKFVRWTAKLSVSILRINPTILIHSRSLIYKLFKKYLFNITYLLLFEDLTSENWKARVEAKHILQGLKDKTKVVQTDYLNLEKVVFYNLKCHDLLLVIIWLAKGGLRLVKGENPYMIEAVIS